MVAGEVVVGGGDGAIVFDRKIEAACDERVSEGKDAVMAAFPSRLC